MGQVAYGAHSKKETLQADVVTSYLSPTISVDEYSCLGIGVAGGLDTYVNVEVSIDGQFFAPISVYNVSTATIDTGMNQDGVYYVNTSGVSQIRFASGGGGSAPITIHYKKFFTHTTFPNMLATVSGSVTILNSPSVRLSKSPGLLTLSMSSTVNVSAALDLTNQAEISLQYVASSGTGTVVFEVSADNTSWTAHPFVYEAPNSLSVGSQMVIGGSVLWRTISLAGFRYFRIRCFATGTGTAQFNYNASPFPTYQALHSVGNIIPGSGSTNLGKAIDSVVGGTDVGIGALIRRVDSPGTITPAANDWTTLQCSNHGHLWIELAISRAWVLASGTLAFGAIAGTHALILAAAASRVGFVVSNSTNVELMFSFDAGTTDHLLVPPGETVVIAQGSFCRVAANSAIHVKHLGTAPTSGRATVLGIV